MLGQVVEVAALTGYPISMGHVHVGQCPAERLLHGGAHGGLTTGRLSSREQVLVKLDGGPSSRHAYMLEEQCIHPAGADWSAHVRIAVVGGRDERLFDRARGNPAQQVQR